MILRELLRSMTPVGIPFRNGLCDWIIIFFNNKYEFCKFLFALCNLYVLPYSVGNAMGYIRMIRSGGLHCCSNAIRYSPVLICLPCSLILQLNFPLSREPLDKRQWQLEAFVCGCLPPPPPPPPPPPREDFISVVSTYVHLEKQLFFVKIYQCC